MIETVEKMKEHLENTGFFERVMVSKSGDDFIFECYYKNELSRKQESELRSQLEQYGPSFSYETTQSGEEYLKIIISNFLIDNR